MKRINSSSELKDVILQMENRKVIQEQLLREQFHQTYKNLNVFNIIRVLLKERLGSLDVQDDIIDSLANIVARYISKLILKGTPEGELKKNLNTLLNHGISTIITKNSENIRIITECFIDSFLKDKKSEMEETE